MAESRCRGYTVTGPADTAFVVGTLTDGIGIDSVIPDSIGFCRKWASLTPLVTFETSSPIRARVPGSNIGRPSGQTWEGFGEGYRGAAIPVDAALSLGLVTSEAVNLFISGGTSREELTTELVTGETVEKKKHALKMQEAARLDRDRISLADELGTQAGKVGAGIANFAGKVLGKTVGNFVGSLGPYGALALGVVVVGGGAYLLAKSEAVKRLGDLD